MDKTLWGHCLETLEGETPSQPFAAWIKPLQAEVSDKELLLIAPNSFILGKVKENFITKIKETVKLKSGRKPPKIILMIDRRKNRAINNQPAANTLEFHSIAFNPKLTFESFIVGKSNLLAEAASRQVAENLTSSNNPLFIYGNTGLGKTHLIHSIGNSIFKNNPQATIAYKSSESFISDMVKALQQKETGQFEQFHRNVDVLIIDDVQYFSGKERSQEAFIHTLDSLLENKSQIILTCNQSLKKIKGLDERLKSRFGWGLPVEIESPDFDTRMSILTDKAQQEDYNLPQEVALLIANEINGDIRELESSLRRVIAYSRFKEEITSISTHKALEISTSK